MDCWCWILIGVLCVYGLIEVHYFIRMCVCVMLARFVKKNIQILDTSYVTGLCYTTDVDTLLFHMNNCRYFRELDFARVDFYERTGLYKLILQKKGSVFQGAATIRYRRFIRPFTRFRLTSRIVYWDDQNIYMEHRFLSLKDGFIHCVVLCRQRLCDCSGEEIMAELINRGSNGSNKVGTISTASLTSNAASINRVENGATEVLHDKLKPDLPLEVHKWIEYNDISSANLRSNC